MEADGTWSDKGLGVSFAGRLLARVDERDLGTTGGGWWELDLYRTERETYVLDSAFNLCRPGNRGVCSTRSRLSFATVDELLRFLGIKDYVPTGISARLISLASESDPAFG